MCFFMPFRMLHVRQSWCYCTLHTVSVVYTHETKKPVHEQRWKVYILIFFTFFLIFKKKIILVHLHVFYLPGISYILASVLLWCGSVWTRWFLSSSSLAWYRYIFPFDFFANLNVSFFISRKCSLPLRHKKNITSNQHLWSKPSEVSGDKVKLVYSVLRSSGSMDSVWSTLVRPLRFKSTLTVEHMPFAFWNTGSLIMSIFNSWLKCLLKPNLMLFRADNLYSSPFFFQAFT